MICGNLSTLCRQCQTEFIYRASLARRSQERTDLTYRCQVNILRLVHLNEECGTDGISIITRLQLYIAVVSMIIYLYLGLSRQVVELAMTQRTVAQAIPTAIRRLSVFRVRCAIYVAAKVSHT